MIAKLKALLAPISGLIALIFGALLFSQRRKTEQAESQLVSALTNTEIKLNDQAREAATTNADKLVDDYHKLRGDDR